MRLRSILLAVAAAAGLVPHSSAQSVSTAFQPASTLVAPAGLGSLAPARHPVAGRFFETTQTDLGWLVNGQPLLLVAPESLGAFAPLGLGPNETVHDVATASGAGSDGRDALATVGNLGLRLRSFHPATGSFVSSSLSTHLNWLGAKLVRAGEIDGPGALDYVGVCSNSAAVVARFNGAAQAPRFGVPSTILDLELVQWDADAALELALLTHWGVYVYETSGTQLAAHARPGAVGGLIGVIHRAGELDRLAWVSPSNSPGVDPSLYEVVPGAGSPALLIPDLDREIVRLSVADVREGLADPDGNSDLLLMSASNCAPVLFRHQTSGNTFRSSASELVNPGALGGCHLWDPLLGESDTNGAQDFFLGDLNDDSFPDLVTCISQDSDGGSGEWNAPRFEFLRGGDFTASPQPELPVFLHSAIDRTDTHTGLRHVYLQINTDPATLPPEALAGTADAIELNVWPEIGGLLTAPSTIRKCFKLPSGWNHAGSMTTIDFEVDEEECFGDAASDHIYWIEVRFVQTNQDWNPQNPYVATPAGSGYVAYLGTNSTILYDYFVSGVSQGHALGLPDVSDCCEVAGPSPDGCKGTTFPYTPGLGKRPRVKPDSANTVPTKSTTVSKVPVLTPWPDEGYDEWYYGG